MLIPDVKKKHCDCCMQEEMRVFSHGPTCSKSADVIYILNLCLNWGMCEANHLAFKKMSQVQECLKKACFRLSMAFSSKEHSLLPGIQLFQAWEGPPGAAGSVQNSPRSPTPTDCQQLSTDIVFSFQSASQGSHCSRGEEGFITLFSPFTWKYALIIKGGNNSPWQMSLH